MTINTQKLRDLVTFDFELPVSVRDAVDAACDHIDTQAAEIAEAKGQIEHLDKENNRLRRTLPRLLKGFEAGRDNASEMFKESGKEYHEGRLVAYDQAAADVRAVLQEKPNA